MDICIDFDGTCVSHEFPRIGKDIGAVPVLKALVEKGHNLILFTMRSNQSKDLPEGGREYTLYLADAVDWFKKKDIPLFGIQENPNQKTWTSSPKAYGQMYIDDAALGIPLKMDKCSNVDCVNVVVKPSDCPICKGRGVIGRPYVDWVKVQEMLIVNGIL